MQRTRRTPAEFCMRSARKFNKSCSTFARFLAECWAISKRRHRAISPPIAALNVPSIFRRRACCATHAAHAKSSFDDANVSRARRQTRKFSSQNAPPTQLRAVPTFQSFTQRRRLDWWCVAHHRRRKFATSPRTFAREIFTISAESALHATFLRCQTLH